MSGWERVEEVESVGDGWERAWGTGNRRIMRDVNSK